MTGKDFMTSADRMKRSSSYGSIIEIVLILVMAIILLITIIGSNIYAYRRGFEAGRRSMEVVWRAEICK